MNLNPNSWHVKVYQFSTSLFEVWKNTSYQTEFEWPLNTNLCPYMRRILVTLPLLLLFYASIVWFVFYALIYWPAVHIGLTYFTSLLLGILAVAAVVGFVIGVCYVFPKIKVGFMRYIGEPIGRFFNRISDSVSDCVMGSPDAPSFCGIMRQWLIDRHDMICRPITIGGE